MSTLSPTVSPRPRSRAAGTFGPIYQLLLRSQATRGRLLCLGLIGLVGVGVAWAVSQAHPADTGIFATRQQLRDAARFADTYGFILLVPVTTLVFASASLGDLREDESMVYLWLRPISRWQVPVAAHLASVTITIPLVGIPLAVSTWIIAGDLSAALWTLAATAVIVPAYAALFVLLGLHVRQALVWGLGYIIIWEGFVAQTGGTPGKMALRSYSRSILADGLNVTLELGNISPLYRYLTPLLITVVALVLAWRAHALQDL